jgi:hypothetical protein
LVRKIAAIYAVLLTLAALTNYIPGLTDAQGRVFGIFALDIYDDALHLASATWAAHACAPDTATLEAVGGCVRVFPSRSGLPMSWQQGEPHPWYGKLTAPRVSRPSCVDNMPGGMLSAIWCQSDG